MWGGYYFLFNPSINLFIKSVGDDWIYEEDCILGGELVDGKLTDGKLTDGELVGGDIFGCEASVSTRRILSS